MFCSATAIYHCSQVTGLHLCLLSAKGQSRQHVSLNQFTLAVAVTHGSYSGMRRQHKCSYTAPSSVATVACKLKTTAAPFTSHTSAQGADVGSSL